MTVTVGKKELKGFLGKIKSKVSKVKEGEMNNIIQRADKGEWLSESEINGIIEILHPNAQYITDFSKFVDGERKIMQIKSQTLQSTEDVNLTEGGDNLIEVVLNIGVSSEPIVYIANTSSSGSHWFPIVIQRVDGGVEGKPKIQVTAMDSHLSESGNTGDSRYNEIIVELREQFNVTLVESKNHMMQEGGFECGYLSALNSAVLLHEMSKDKNKDRTLSEVLGEEINFEESLNEVIDNVQAEVVEQTSDITGVVVDGSNGEPQEDTDGQQNTVDKGPESPALDLTPAVELDVDTDSVDGDSSKKANKSTPVLDNWEEEILSVIDAQKESEKKISIISFFLIYGEKNNQKEIIENLQSLPLTPDYISKTEFLKKAAKKGFLEVVKFIVENSGLNSENINQYEQNSYYPLDEAMGHGHFDVAEYLLQKGACANPRKIGYKFHPLTEVPRTEGDVGFLRCVQAFSDYGEIDINHKDNQSNDTTLLSHFITREESLDRADLMIKYQIHKLRNSATYDNVLDSSQEALGMLRKLCNIKNFLSEEKITRLKGFAENLGNAINEYEANQSTASIYSSTTRTPERFVCYEDVSNLSKGNGDEENDALTPAPGGGEEVQVDDLETTTGAADNKPGFEKLKPATPALDLTPADVEDTDKEKVQEEKVQEVLGLLVAEVVEESRDSAEEVLYNKFKKSLAEALNACSKGEEVNVVKRGSSENEKEFSLEVVKEVYKAYNQHINEELKGEDLPSSSLNGLSDKQTEKMDSFLNPKGKKYAGLGFKGEISQEGNTYTVKIKEEPEKGTLAKDLGLKEGDTLTYTDSDELGLVGVVEKLRDINSYIGNDTTVEVKRKNGNKEEEVIKLKLPENKERDSSQTLSCDKDGNVSPVDFKKILRVSEEVGVSGPPMSMFG